MVTQQQKIQHLFLRATFSETPDKIKAVLTTPINTIVDDLFHASEVYKDIDYIDSPLYGQEDKGVGGVKVVKLILKSKKETEELNNEWLFKMAYTKAPLREKMVFFWHNHFSTNVAFSYLMQVQNNTLRKYAIGKFGDLLHAISKDPAMIFYLNNQQNRKRHPNENFAREVMELFTLGIGHYTEKDIKEAARAFTGWSVNDKGEFVLNEKAHDSDEKEFLGKKGNFNGDDIINIILEQKQTAIYIESKIYREFVNDSINLSRVDELADGFYKSGYDISALMKKIFTSDWFYDEENIGNKIGSPVELIVRYKKLFGLEFEKPQTQINLQHVLGQVLFFPPNVAGWKGGQNWIDSSSLILRLNMPHSILNNSGMDVQAKPAFEEDPLESYRKKKIGVIKSDWTAFANNFIHQPKEKQLDDLLESLIQCDKSRIKKDLIEANIDNSSDEKRIISMAANIMSLPEFQLI